MAIDLSGPVIVIFCALEREADVLRRRLRHYRQVQIQTSGMGYAAARQCAERRLQREPRPHLVVAAGFCGALRPDLRAGDIVCDAAVHTVPHVLSTPEEKQLWAKQTAALAVDLESAAVTEACQRFGVPCRVIRSVSDTCKQAIPRELLDCWVEQRLRVRKFLHCVWRRPALLGELVRLGWQSRRAAQTLAAAVEDCVKQFLMRKDKELSTSHTPTALNPR
ncbi:MAG: hypothetical protein WHU94_12480 [Thermogemmata sp.]|jgi:hypothetical protein|uniref:Nucleoside phosphorylase domain-containing protein n=1 Tax=Thermogemmata fonticola TaxID=2755323 RepID=A0A7V9ABF3_9BACT|nr:hypothetical protein [Thermogemmata fonticola]MBA2226161.1 hypothetical protein [Thermogemmata fonticola]MCX8141073.1 hypothetical protein [Gemmataceae bacterium]